MQKFKSLFIVGAFLSTAIMPIISFGEIKANASPCVGITDNQVISFFDRWNESLKTTNPDKVVENYADDAILLPTLSNMPHKNHAQLREYFVTFLKNNPSGVVDERVIRHGCDWATDSGIYTFEFNKDGKKEFVKARYSFVYEDIDGKWLIIAHHSSLMPNAQSLQQDKEQMSKLEGSHQ